MATNWSAKSPAAIPDRPFAWDTCATASQADTTVTIGDRDKVFADIGQQQPNAAPDSAAQPGEAKLGVVVRDVSPQTAAKLHTQGVVIQSVRSGSFADLQGLDPGLVIIRINKLPTSTKDQFDAVVSKLKTGDDVVFEILDPRLPTTESTTLAALCSNLQ